MKNEDQIRSLVVAIEDKENIIRKLTAEVGNLEVQNADYSQIVAELSDKLKLYESKYGTVSVSYTHLTLPTTPYV